MSLRDIEQARAVAQEAWSDIATRDAGRRISYPMRSRKIIESYVKRSPNGCFVAEIDGKIIGCVYSHVWGKLGWIGPIEVLPNYQNKGVGSSLISCCEQFLLNAGCNTIGIETMPHILKNMHLYLKCGYVPIATTVIAEKIIQSRRSFSNGEKGKIMKIEQYHAELKKDISLISQRIMHGMDVSNEVELVLDNDLGSILAFFLESRVIGIASIHTYLRDDEGDYSFVKFLLVDKQFEDREKVFDSLLLACENESFESGKKKMYVRFPIVDQFIYPKIQANDFKIRGTGIQMFKGKLPQYNSNLMILSLAG
ncbi:MAG: GNAT family N-acetyltransferase [Methanomassiliicoccales archaeon]